jgi:phosphohistidine phosphatase SixA
VRSGLLLAASALLSAGLAHAQPGAGAKVDANALLAELRQGGLVVYFRHTRTLRQHDHEGRMRAAGTLDPDKCETQRNLSEAGLAEAQRQAEAVRRLGVPVGRVYSSRYCRAWQHAGYFASTLEYSEALTPDRTPEKAAALQVLLNTAPTQGTNTLLFGHGGVLWQATDYDSIESETFVFRPAKEGRARLVASIRMEEWEDLLAGRACCAPRPFWVGKPPPGP